jgi:hypothetical protein
VCHIFTVLSLSRVFRLQKCGKSFATGLQRFICKQKLLLLQQNTGYYAQKLTIHTYPASSGSLQSSANGRMD